MGVASERDVSLAVLCGRFRESECRFGDEVNAAAWIASNEEDRGSNIKEYIKPRRIGANLLGFLIKSHGLHVILHGNTAALFLLEKFKMLVSSG